MRSPQSGCQLLLEEVCCLATRIQESKKRPKPSRSDIAHARSNSTCAMALTPRHQNPRNEVQIHGDRKQLCLAPQRRLGHSWYSRRRILENRQDTCAHHTTATTFSELESGVQVRYIVSLCDIYGWVWGEVYDISSGSKVTYLCPGGSVRWVAKVT